MKTNAELATNYAKYVDFAERLADVARERSLPYFRRPLAIEHKHDDSPVTVADRETEAIMRAHLQERFPDHSLFGEEHGYHRGESQYTWVIDPIDGTKSFITGMPLFGTLIALLEDGVPIIGIVDMPALKERWVGARGHATLFNGERVATRECRTPSDAVLYTTTPQLFVGVDRGKYERLAAATSLQRFGGDCYAYGLLALGFVDLVVEAQLQPYDYLALVPVIENAGGRITDWQGKPLDLDSSGHVLAAGDATLHAQALALLAG